VTHNAHAPGSVLHRSGAKALDAKAKLNELHARVTDAVDTYRFARERAATPHADADRVSHDLLAYHSAVTYRQRSADPDEAYRVSVELLQRIEDEGLILVPVDPRHAVAGFRIGNPNLDAAVAATEIRARAAAQERDAFARENSVLLAEHEARQRMTSFKAALEGDDPTAFRDALRDVAGPARDTHTNSLTTHEMAGIR